MPTENSQPEQGAPDAESVKGLSSFAAFVKVHLTREMIIERLYGPIGSFIFHVILVLILFTIVIGASETPQLKEIAVTVENPVTAKPPQEEYKPPEPQKIPDDVEVPDVARPEDGVAVPGASVVEGPAGGGDGGGDSGVGNGVGDGSGSGDGLDGIDTGVNFISDVSGPLVFKGLYAGRGKGGRGAGLAQYAGGMGSLTEASVLKALEWLKNHQQPNGSWHKVNDDYNVAFTGLAVLTFLAHGETMNSERYGETLEKGLRWLIEYQKPNGSFCANSYAHGIATYAVSEGYALTQVPFLREAMDKAVEIVIKGQNGNGGWTYGYAKDGFRDTSVIGWQVQALKAASAAGCTNPDLTDCLKKAASALKLQYHETGRGTPPPSKLHMGTLTGSSLEKSEDTKGQFAYRIQGDAKSTGGGGETMTAVGTLCLEFLGEGASPEAKGGRGSLREYVCDWEKADGWAMYRWYYATQAIFQGQGITGNRTGKEDWKRWNNMFAKAFVNNQNKDGSWRSPSKNGDDNYSGFSNWILDNTGSVYSTTLAALSLMVYYRILPSYGTGHSAL